MSLKGTGIIAIWHDISAEGLQDFYEWHNREHMPERVGIEGFLRGRRYIAVEGVPNFFTLYNVSNPGVLSGPAYHARLNDPTPWTIRAVDYFSNEARSLCEIIASNGIGCGGIVGTIRFDCDLGCDANLLTAFSEKILPAAIGMRAIAAIHICRADLDTSRLRSAEQQGHPDNKVPRWIVLVEGTTVQAVGEAMAGPLGQPALAALGAPETERSIYRLQHDLVKCFN